MTGTRTCEAGASVDAEHAWLKEASAVLYAAPQAAGDGSGSDANNAGSLEAMVAAAGAEATAVLLAPGTYTLSDPLALAVRGPLSLVGPCAAQVTIELGAPMTTSGSVQLYGLAVRGPLSAEEGASNSAIIVSGSGTFKLLQSTVSAPAGHGVELTGAGSDAAVISGVTFGAVRDSALHATDALGSWTIEATCRAGPSVNMRWLLRAAMRTSPYEQSFGDFPRDGEEEAPAATRCTPRTCWVLGRSRGTCGRTDRW